MNSVKPAPAPSQTARAWHCMTVAEVVGAIGTSLEQGLTAAEAAARLARHGANAIAAVERRSPWRMLLGQFIGAEFPETRLRLLPGQTSLEVCLEGADEFFDRLAVGFSVLHTASSEFPGTTGRHSPRVARFV